ncbi:MULTISPECIES: hypothetical protein [unclassified Streptomyces]|uniref:hypothetical protein n=1 Tax=unclassified Streptomyces TaxID=2593676 RepID=UPI0038221933
MTASGKSRQPGLGWYVTGPLLAVVITVLGGALATQRWADCPHGMDAPTHAGLVTVMPFAWFGMTMLLVVLQAGLVALLPEETDAEVKWVALFVAAGVLALLYISGTGPDTAPDGSCYGG